MNELANTSQVNTSQKQNQEKNNLTSSLLTALASEVTSPLLLRDLHLYEAAIRNNLKKEYGNIDEDELSAKVKEDILEMDEWLFPFNIDANVWKIVLEKTIEGFILTNVDPDDVSHPDSLTFENVDGEEITIDLTQ